MSDPYTTDHAACGTDYGQGKNAFTAAFDRRPEPVLTTSQRQYIRKRAAKENRPTPAAAMLKKATRVNKGDFHIETIAQSQAGKDKARKIAGKSAGG